jgi:hypothetical protein
MFTSWTKLLAVLTLCSTATLGACAMDDASSGGDITGRDDTVTSDAVTSDGAANSSDGKQFSIVNPDGIIVNISVSQWQTDLRAWQMNFMTCRPSVTVNGVFDQLTTTATKCFQGNCGLSRDGIVGNNTLGQMCATLSFMGRTDLFNASHCTQADKLLLVCL